MLDFSKTFCDLHPNELISNFCSKEQCMVGLCATCICNHTQSHVQRNTHPQYENIRMTYTKMQQSIRERISCLQIEKERISRIIEKIESKKQKATDLVEQARRQSLDFVNRFFDAKQKQIMRRIEAEDKKVGLHNEGRMDALLNLISRDLNSLFTSAQDLSSQNFLESFQRIKTQVLANSIEMQKEISLELERNEKYEAFVTINPIYINDVKNGLQRCLNLTFTDVKIANAPIKILQESSTLTNHPLTIIQDLKRQSRIWYQQTNPQPIQRRVDSQPKQTHQMRPNSSHFEQSYHYPTQNQRVIQQSLTKRPPNQQIMFFAPNYQTQMQNPNIQMDLRANSTQKCIKQNNVRYLTHPSHLDTNYSTNGNLNSQFSIANSMDLGKKVKKSGLSVMRNIQNESKLSYL